MNNVIKFALGSLITTLLAAPTVLAQTTITVVMPDFGGGLDAAYQQNGVTTLVGTSLRLTPSVNGQFGTAFYKERVSLANDRSFSAYFTFSMTAPSCGLGGGVGADGLAFVVQTDSNSAGSAGGGIGYAGIEPSLAIEFDTFVNGGIDPSGDHIGVNIDGNTTSVASTLTGSPLNDGTVYHVWVDYIAASDLLEVRFDVSDTRPASATLTHTLDLASEIGEYVYVGFTAATGGCRENHFIHSFYFNNDFLSGGIDPGGSYIAGPAGLDVTGGSSLVANGTDSVSISATAVDALGTPVPNADITFTTDVGTLNLGSATTNSSGVATVTLSSSSAGTASVRAVAPGGVTDTHEVTVLAPTPTPTPTATPVITPPAVATPNGGGTVDTTPTITGTGPANSTIRVYIGSDLVGTTTTDSNGNWTFSFGTALSKGTYVVTAVAVDSFGNTSAASSNSSLIVRGEVVLDFDGDGVSDFATHKASNITVNYRVVQSSDSSEVNEQVAGQLPAPGDYDGDGLWDYVSIDRQGKQLIWRGKLSALGSDKQVRIGAVGDTALIGCRLHVPARYSAAVVRGQTIRYANFGSTTERRRSLAYLGKRRLIGCGDVDGDNKDELLFFLNSYGKKGPGVIAVDLNGKVKRFKSAAPYQNAIVIRNTDSGKPIAALARWSAVQGRVFKLISLGAPLSVSTVVLPGDKIEITSGSYLISSELKTAIMHQAGASRVDRRVVESGTSSEFYADNNGGYFLTRPQTVLAKVLR